MARTRSTVSWTAAMMTSPRLDGFKDRRWRGLDLLVFAAHARNGLAQQVAGALDRLLAARPARLGKLGEGAVIRELHAHRRRNRFAEGDRLAVGERGQEGQRALRRGAGG